MYAFGPGWSVVVVCNRGDTGALELQTPASLISPSAIRDYAVELRGFEPLTPSLRTILRGLETPVFIDLFDGLALARLTILP